MQVPEFVRRATWRVMGGGVIAAAVIAGVGLAGERLRFGRDLAGARAQIERDVRQEFSSLATRLETAVEDLRRDDTITTINQTRDQTRTRQLFERLTGLQALLRVPEVAITVYDQQARPLAWVGRPATLPIGRLTGSDALFLAESSLGLRLTRVAPVDDLQDSSGRRLATLVVEAPLPRTSRAPDDPAGFVIDTSVVPVPLRLGFEAAGTDGAIVVEGPGGDPLALVEVPADDVATARRARRTALAGVELGVLAAVLLLLTGPLLDWRRPTRRVSGHVVLTLAILALLAGARAIAWVAVRLFGLAMPPLVATDESGPIALLVASAPDFVLTAFLIAGVVGLAASSFEQWRQSRRLAVTPVPSSGALAFVAFVAAQLAAGAAVGALLVAYERFLRTHLALMPFDLLHFSINPLEWSRLAVGIGLVVLHATLLAAAVLVFRLAMAPWVVSGGYRWLRAWIPLLWAAPVVLVLVSAMRDWERPPLVPAALIGGVAIAAAWRLRRYRVALEHASQAARLTAFFVALAVPSIVVYPSLVEAHGRAHRQLVESRYAPEVVNQRRNLQTQVNEAIEQIDAITDLADLITAVEPAIDSPPSTDTAFHVWERTVLKNQRSTAVELHDVAGTLASRFALELPLAGGPQTYRESTCQWEIFEEVAPFFAEERRLLHAGRGVCRSVSGKRTPVGSVAVRVMLDYSNLSFISAQSPYVALLRDPRQQAPSVTPRDAVEFTVYGWSRRPLYMSGRSAWPLDEATFRRVFASRDPFWATVQRAGTEYEVYYLNDRGAIYALGYPRPSGVGHLITIAELLALTGVTYLLMLVAGLVYGAIAARTPTSGRELLREVRASFYRKLFIAFVAAAVVPVLALALVTRAYIADLMQTDLEMEATRTAASASRVVEDVGTLEAPDGTAAAAIDDDLVVWLSRVIAQDVNIFDGSGLLASSERNLFASGLLPTRTQGDVYRAILLEGRPSFVSSESVGAYSYLIAAAPVRVQNREAILTVPLTLRQQEIDAQIDELDRRVLLAAVLFIMLGGVIGYSMAERIADPVNRLMKATGRIARGDLDARILATSSDEFRRLVEAFNRMAADLQRQRVELERTNRLAAWADMARQVAHDIKNPLTPIQLNAEHLRRVHQDRGEPLGQVLDECVNNVLTQVRLLRQIASEFSSFASSPTVRPAAARLDELIADVIGPYRAGLSERVTIDVDVPSDLPSLMLDKNVLARALTNIIENALHAMPGGGTLAIAGVRFEDRVELRIADTGVGMDAAALDRIFEPYFSTRASGTGLGLTIAKRNVELNGGTIAVDSAKGVGTTVRLTFPLPGPRPPGRRAQASDELSSSRSEGGLDSAVS